MKTTILILLIFLSSVSFGQEKEPVPANSDTSRIKNDSLITNYVKFETNPNYKRSNAIARFFDDFDEFWVGARVNFYQGKYAYIGLGLPITWNVMCDIIPLVHIGITPGMDINISGSTPTFVPKISIEGQYFIGVARIGYQHFTDFSSRHDNRLFLEAGLTFFSYFDITYLHSFSFDGNPLNQGNSYFNLTLTLPIYKVD